MNSSVMPMVIANLTATGCALLLTRRGPSPRLRLLTLTVGMMSLAQTTSFLYAQGVWTGGQLYMQHVHHELMAGFSLLAIYLLGKEILDRNLTDKRLRLAEHEAIRVECRQTAQWQSIAKQQVTEPLTALEMQQLPLAGYTPSPQPKAEMGRVQPFQPTSVRGFASYEPTDRQQLHVATVQASLDLLTLLERVADARTPVRQRHGHSSAEPQLARVER